MTSGSFQLFHTHNSFMPCDVPSAEVNSAIQKYCQRGPSFANGDQELFTSEVIVFPFETKGTQKHCLVKKFYGPLRNMP